MRLAPAAFAAATISSAALLASAAWPTEALSGTESESGSGTGIPSPVSERIPAPERKTDGMSGTGGESKLRAAESLNRLADALAKKRLPAYVLTRYGNAPAQTRERFRTNFEMVSEIDAKAEIHPAYLANLQKRILAAPALKEDGALFGAYAHILLSLREAGGDVSKSVEKRRKTLPAAIRKAYEGKTSAPSDEAALRTLEELGIPVFDAAKVDAMRKTIERELVGPQTRYFAAYAYARKRFLNFDGKLSVPGNIPHTKQAYPLSCESNSLRDLLNSYRLRKGESPIAEEAVVLLLPSFPELPEYRGGARVWSDPEKGFVGRIDGRQSSNPKKLTGYGIHADGTLPYVRRELKRYGLKIDKGTFDAASIVKSLAKGNPVVFWYAMTDDPNRGFARLEWTTPEGRGVVGYVGQHTGIIVGGKIGTDGKLTEVSYYE